MIGRELPQGWLETTVGEVVEPITAVDPGKNPDQEFSYIDIGSIDNERNVISSPKRLRGAEAPSRARREVRENDVLFSTVRPYLKNIAMVPREFDGDITSTGVAVLRPMSAVLPLYLFSVVRGDAFVRAVSAASDGTMYPAVSDKDVLLGKLPLPPLAEQRRIVEKIEALTARSRRAKEALAALPALLDRYRQSVLAAAFRGDLTADWRDAHGRLDEVADQSPAGWSLLRIEELASSEPRSIQSGPFGSSLRHSEFTSSGILVIGIDNVQDGYFSLGRQNRISEAKFAELKKYAARAGDVLITVMATVGRCAVVPHDCETALITKHVYRISPNTSLVYPRYLMSALRGAPTVLAQMGANTRGQTRPGINGGILKRLCVPVAPLDEQAVLVARLDRALSWADTLQARLKDASDRLATLDQSIFAKAFRGELVPQDPADEPASVLVDRIRADRAAAGAGTRRRGRARRCGAA